MGITIKNLNELKKVLKANENKISQFLTGEKDFECPNCGTVNKVKFPNNRKVKCNNSDCNCEINLNFDLQ